MWLLLTWKLLGIYYFWINTFAAYEESFWFSPGCYMLLICSLMLLFSDSNCKWNVCANEMCAQAIICFLPHGAVVKAYSSKYKVKCFFCPWKLHHRSCKLPWNDNGTLMAQLTKEIIVRCWGDIVAWGGGSKRKRWGWGWGGGSKSKSVAVDASTKHWTRRWQQEQEHGSGCID